MRRHPVPKVTTVVAGALLATASASSQTTKTTTTTTVVETRAEPKAGKADPPPAAMAPILRFDVNGFNNGLGQPAGNVVANGRIANTLERQYRMYLRAEYHVLRTACALTEEQRKLVAGDAERALKEASARFERARREMQQNVQLRKPGDPPKAMSLPEPTRLIQECLAEAAEPHLTPQQVADYRREVSERAEEKKRVAIEAVVAWFDRQFLLSPPQREQLSQSLGSRWDESWFPTPFILANAERYYSRIPKHLILPALDETQRDLWAANPRGLFPSNGMVSILTPAMMQDDLEDEELAEARRAEESKAGPTPASIPGFLSR